MVDDIPLNLIHTGLNHAVLYIAGFVELKILKRLKCGTFMQLLNECDEIDSIFIKRKSYGFLRYPRTDTYKIATVSEKFLIYIN